MWLATLLLVHMYRVGQYGEDNSEHRNIADNNIRIICVRRVLHSSILLRAANQFSIIPMARMDVCLAFAACAHSQRVPIAIRLKIVEIRFL